MPRLINIAATLILTATTACTATLATAADHSQHNMQAQPQADQHSALRIHNPWSRPTPPGAAMGVGYMTITNTGDQPITLIAADSPRAGQVSIHQSRMQDGVMRMEPLKDGLVIAAGETVELKPHSYHLMLERLKEPLREGENIPLTLSFDGAPDVRLELMVQPLDGQPAKMEHSVHSH